MSAGNHCPAPSGSFEQVYPDLSLNARSLASAIRADGVRVGQVATGGTAEAIAQARLAAERIASLARRFLEATEPGGEPITPE